MRPKPIAATLIAALLMSGCGGTASRRDGADERASAVALGDLARRTQELADRYANDLDRAIAAGEANGGSVVDRARSIDADYGERFRALALEASTRAQGTRDAEVARAFAALAAVGAVKIERQARAAQHETSDADLTRFFCRIADRRDDVAAERSASLAFDADAREVRQLRGVPVSQFGAARDRHLDDAYAGASYGVSCVAGIVFVMGQQLEAAVRKDGPTSAAALEAAELAGLLGGVVHDLGGGPPAHTAPRIARIWRTTSAFARTEDDIWSVRAAAYVRHRAPKIAAGLTRRELVGFRAWVNAVQAPQRTSPTRSRGPSTRSLQAANPVLR